MTRVYEIEGDHVSFYVLKKYRTRSLKYRWRPRWMGGVYFKPMWYMKLRGWVWKLFGIGG